MEIFSPKTEINQNYGTFEFDFVENKEKIKISGNWRRKSINDTPLLIFYDINVGEFVKKMKLQPYDENNIEDEDDIYGSNENLILPFVVRVYDKKNVFFVGDAYSNDGEAYFNIRLLQILEQHIPIVAESVR